MTYKEKIEKGLRTINIEKFDKLPAQERIMVVMYFAEQPMSAKQVAPFVHLSESQCKAVMEASR